MSCMPTSTVTKSVDVNGLSATCASICVEMSATCAPGCARMRPVGFATALGCWLHSGNPMGYAVPLGPGWWVFDPDELHALGIELAQHGKQLVRRLLGAGRHAPMAQSRCHARRHGAGIYRQAHAVLSEHLQSRVKHRALHQPH